MAGRNATSGVGPRVLQVLEFAGARAPELQALHELAHDVRVVSAADEKLLSQKNQRRRRANAFNSHRMPQRLRRNAKKDKKKPAAADNGGESVRRCRKHERRPHKLVEQRSWEAAADSGRSVLLPTHLWHAKRMKMQEQHGVVVAAHRADKSISAALEVCIALVGVRSVWYCTDSGGRWKGAAQDHRGARHVVLRRAGAVWTPRAASRSAAARFGVYTVYVKCSDAGWELTNVSDIRTPQARISTACASSPARKRAIPCCTMLVSSLEARFAR